MEFKNNKNKTYNNYKKLFIPAREMRKNQTLSEKKFWDIIKDRQINDLKFLRQKIIGEFIADFYCHNIKLIIEIDGKIHENLKERDVERENFLKSRLEIKIIRYTNDFILNNNNETIKEKLLSDLKCIKNK
ncbi:MAG: DUF559 domain-containing protein [Candidatus Nomurabacteria bacterium]